RRRRGQAQRCAFMTHYLANSPLPAPPGSRSRLRSLLAVVTATALAASGLTGASWTAAQSAHAIELPEPVAQYRFDTLTAAGDGIVIPDTTGNGHDAVVVGSGATLTNGPLGEGHNALSLPGGASGSAAPYVKLPPLAEAFAGKTDATFSMWVNAKGGAACQWFGALGTALSRHMFASPDCGGFLTAVNVGGEKRASGGGAIRPGWTHIALVLTGGQRLTVFKDGVKV